MTPEERAIAAWMRGPAAPLTEAAIAAARRHRVHLLIADALGAASAEGWGAPLRRELRTCAVLHTRREAVLQKTLAALRAGAVDVLLLKGAALAYLAYDAPHLRPRVDTDLLIRREAVKTADAILQAEGWIRAIESDAELASTQRPYTRTIGGHDEHLDLHWRVANPPAFARVLSFDELASRAIAVAPLGPFARTPSIPDALFLACVHLVAHHADDVALVWLVDIERLAGMLTSADREWFVTLAIREEMRAVCRHALEETELWLGPGAAAALAAALPGGAGVELSAEWLQRRSRAGRLGRELAALSSWSERATLLREHLFPSAAYLRTKYPRCPDLLLPLAALHRILAGAPAWLRSSSRHAR